MDNWDQLLGLETARVVFKSAYDVEEFTTHLSVDFVSEYVDIWEFAPKRYLEISSLIPRYPKISLNSKKSKDKFEGYERISFTG